MPPENINQKISDMKKQGLSNSKIIDTLKKEGHTSQEIYDSLSNEGKQPANDLEAPAPISEEMGAGEAPISKETPEATEQLSQQEVDFGMPPMRSPPPTSIPNRQNIEQIEEIAESIIEEKWDELNASVGNLNMWKEKTDAEIEAIKQEILRIRHSFENLNNTIIGRVDEYGKGVTDLGVEIKALNKVMEKIIQPLSSNVKELSMITEKFKKK